MSIRADGDDGVRTLDVAMCAHTPIADLLPALNDATQLWPREGDPRGWRLDRPVGGSLDTALSLRSNGIRDGDVLILASTEAPVPQLRGWEPARVVAAADAPELAAGAPLRELLVTTTLLIGAVALAWSGIGERTVGHLVVAACGALAVGHLAVTGRHRWLPVAAAALAATTGFLAVPAGPAASNVLLACTATFATAVVMARLSGGLTEPLVAVASSAALGSVAASIAMLVTLPLATLGVILATGALVLLAAAPRIAITSSGWRPRPDGAPSVDATNAQAGHVALTGVAAGASAAVVIGLIQVAIGCLHDRGTVVAGLAFVCAVALVVLMRARTYVDRIRRLTLAIAGLLGGTAALVVGVAAAPEWSCWAVAAAGAAGIAALRGRRPSAGATRAAELLDYLALTAVIPLACWVAGGYALARDLHLT